jgi:hypothetical protein
VIREVVIGDWPFGGSDLWGGVVLVVQQFQARDRHLMDFVRKAPDPGAVRDLVEAAHAIFVRAELGA